MKHFSCGPKIREILALIERMYLGPFCTLNANNFSFEYFVVIKEDFSAIIMA